MHWAVVGDRGLLGSELAAFLEGHGEKVSRFSRLNLDLEELALELAPKFNGIDIVVNCVAYTAVDAAESALFDASTINGLYAGKLAEAAKMAGARFFHVSTDYVFDGLGGTPYKTDAVVNPTTGYGHSKLLGEKLVRGVGGHFSIFRTSWLYGAKGKCFAKTIAGKLVTEGAAKVVNDQVGSPTWTKDLAEVIYQHGILGLEEPVVHAVSSGSCSWFEFAIEISKALPASDYFVEPVSSEDFAPPAKRPAYSVLDNTQTSGPIIGNWRNRWRVAAPEVLEEFLGN